MCSLIEELKADARRLQREAAHHTPSALERLRRSAARLPKFKRGAGEDASVKRRHCLTAIARELGFNGWQHLLAMLDGHQADDFGTLLYPNGPAAYWNVWSVSHDEASEIRRAQNGYLLAYKRDLFVCDQHFIDHLGVSHTDADWDLIGRDWVRPSDLGARRRLYEKLIRVRRQALQAT